MATPGLAFSEATVSLTTDAALGVVTDALDQIDHVARARLSGAERLALVTRARHAARRLEALVVTLVSEADAIGASTAAQGTSTTSWLALEGGTSSKEAAGLVFAAADTTRYQAVRDAALAGEVGVGQARAIAAGMGELPATLSDGQRDAAVGLFLTKGADLPAAKIKALAPQILAEVAPEQVLTIEDTLSMLDAQRERAHRRRAFSWTRDGDGSVLLKGSLPELAAEPFIQMIEAGVESERRAGRDRAQDRRPEDFRTGDQRRADALLTLAAAWQDARHAPTVAGDRPRIVVTLREADLRDRAEQAGLLADGTQISAGDLRRLCCDADLTPIVLGTNSEILDVGRTQRLVTPPIRRALSIRDGGCTFPGCQTPDSRCDAHHITPWWAGGTTSIDNLVLLCPHHHGIVEPPRLWEVPPPDRWEVQLNQLGLPEFIPPRLRDPNRQPIPGNRPGVAAIDPDERRQVNLRSWALPGPPVR